MGDNDYPASTRDPNKPAGDIYKETPAMADTPVTEAGKPVEKPAAAVPAADGEDGGEAGPSKKALKKAEAKAKKEAEKARRAAEHLASQAAAKAAAGNTEDLAKDSYGPVQPTGDATKVAAPRVNLKKIDDSLLGQTIKLRAWIQNSRMQGAKMAFVELREERDWAIQGVVAASPEGKPVSKQMVKWIGALNLESFVLIEGRIEKPLEPVKSVRVSNYELHITKCYCIAKGPEVLGMGLAVANRPVANFDDEDPAAVAAAAADGDAAVDAATKAVEAATLEPGAVLPGASMATHLSNPAMHKRAPVQQAIADVRMATRKLFAEYLDGQGFNQFEPPCLIGAASEGGSNVFGLPYFDKQAFLAQSPQFYKQIEIAGGRKRVYCIGPVFRAENSNTPRHMTEVGLLQMACYAYAPLKYANGLVRCSLPVLIWKWKSRKTTSRFDRCSRRRFSTSCVASPSDALSKSR